MTQEAYRDLQYHLMILYGVFTTLLFISSSVYHYHELRFRHLGQYWLSNLLIRQSLGKLKLDIIFIYVIERLSIYL